jgi:hypothetical protein
MRNLQKVYVLAVPNTQPSQGRAIQRGCVPATSTMHVNIRSEGPPLHYTRPLELLVFYCTPIMHSIGVGWVLAQVDASWAVSVNTVFPVVPNRMSRVPAIHESRIRFICRPSVCSYEYVPPCARRSVSAEGSERRAKIHALTISAAPCHTPSESTLSYRSRGPHVNCKYGSMNLFLCLKAWERSAALRCDPGVSPINGPG